MSHEGKKLQRDTLYPVMNASFTTTKDVNIKGQGVLSPKKEYQISGVGFGKLKEDGTRRESWVILHIHDPHQVPIHLFKSDMEKLYDSGIVIDV